VAGDPERAHEVKMQEDGGIWYHDNLITAMVCKKSFLSNMYHHDLHMRIFLILNPFSLY